MNKLFYLCTLIQGHTVYQFPLSYLTQRGAERKWVEGSIRFDPSIFIYPYLKFMGSLKKGMLKREIGQKEQRNGNLFFIIPYSMST